MWATPDATASCSHPATFSLSVRTDTIGEQQGCAQRLGGEALGSERIGVRSGESGGLDERAPEPDTRVAPQFDDPPRMQRAVVGDPAGRRHEGQQLVVRRRVLRDPRVRAPGRDRSKEPARPHSPGVKSSEREFMQ